MSYSPGGGGRLTGWSATHSYTTCKPPTSNTVNSSTNSNTMARNTVTSNTTSSINTTDNVMPKNATTSSKATIIATPHSASPQHNWQCNQPAIPWPAIQPEMESYNQHYQTQKLSRKIMKLKGAVLLGPSWLFPTTHSLSIELEKCHSLRIASPDSGLRDMYFHVHLFFYSA